MKKIFFTLFVTILLISCKKEPKEIGNKSSSESSTDTTKYETNGVFSIGKPIGKFGNGVTDIDGTKYRTVIIGTQEWMGENLKTIKYNDGTLIPNVKDSLNNEWMKLRTGAWCYYNNDEKYNTKYGKLYNWYVTNPTTNGNKNVCPTGWHVPTDGEWTTLINYLGGGFTSGGKMKEVDTTNWISPNINASNTSLFNALPGGFRFYDGGSWSSIYDSGYFWTSSEDTNYTDRKIGRAIVLTAFSGNTSTYSDLKEMGYSIRCIKD